MKNYQILFWVGVALVAVTAVLMLITRLLGQDITNETAIIDGALFIVIATIAGKQT